VVVSEWGTYTEWDELFATDTDALVAFQIVVQEEGMETFLAGDGTETVH